VVGAGVLVLAIAVGRDELAERRRIGLEKRAADAAALGPHED